MLEEWMKGYEIVCVFNKHKEKMGLAENQAHRVRKTRRHEVDNKKVDLFIEIRTSANSDRLKQRVRDLCEEEKFGRIEKSEFEHVKRRGSLLCALVPCACLEWHQKKATEVDKMQKLKVELKKEKAHQNDYSGSGLVVNGV